MFCIGSSSSSSSSTSSSVQAENCSVHFVQETLFKTFHHDYSVLDGCWAPKEGPTTFACKSQECLWQDWYIFFIFSSDFSSVIFLPTAGNKPIFIFIFSLHQWGKTPCRGSSSVEYNLCGLTKAQSVPL